jgi:hypothetical protein
MAGIINWANKGACIEQILVEITDVLVARK